MTCFIQNVLKASVLGEMFVLPSEVIRIIVIDFKLSRVFSVIPLYIPSNVAIMITNYNHLEPLESIPCGWLIAV